MVRVALVGYGYAGKTFHAPLIAAEAGLDLAVIVSSNPAKVHADYPGVAVYPTPQAALDDRSIDLIVVASPNDTHFPLSRDALLAGKHVVVDKPFTVTLGEARDLVALSEQTGRHLTVFHNRRWDGDFLGVRQALQQNMLGRLAHLETRFDRFRPLVRDRWREKSGAGAGLWYDLGPHLIDQVLQLCGLPDRVVASMALQRDGSQTDDWAHVVLEYGPLRAILHCSVLAAGGVNRFMLHGDKASLVKRRVDPQEDQLRAGTIPGTPDWGVDTDRFTIFDGEGGEREWAGPPGDYPAFYRGIAAAIQGTATNPVPPIQSLAVMAVLEAAISSATLGRGVSLPLTEEETQQFTVSSQTLSAIKA